MKMGLFVDSIQQPLVISLDIQRVTEGFPGAIYCIHQGCLSQARISYTFFVGKSMLVVRRSFVTRRGMLGLSHELPSDLLRHPARSPKGYDCNGLGHIVLTSSVRATLMKTLLKQWPKMLRSLSTFQQIGKATWPRLPCLL